MEDRPTNPGKPEVLCRVCGDKASGKHYGVASCDGCRGFFKRSIRRNLEYVCKENGRCVVDVTRRNQCQACRFRKCLQVNMKKDAVQHERAPRSCIPHHGANNNLGGHLLPLPFHSMGLPRRLHGTFFNSLPIPTIHSSHPFFTTPSPNFGEPQNGPYLTPFYPSMFATTTTSTCFRAKVFNPAETESRNVLQGQNEDEVSSSEEAAVQNKFSPAKLPLKNLELRNDDSPTFLIKPGLDISSPIILPSENIYESAAKLLFLSVKWARTIPSFLQLTPKDQSTLLEESWAELFVLTAAQWALPIDEGMLMNNLPFNVAKQMNLEDEAKRLRDVVSRLSLLQIDHTEYACLKALVLFKSDCPSLCDSSYVEILQDQTYIMLQEYCNSMTNRMRLHGDKRAAGAVRFGKVLLVIPAIQSISKRSLELLLFKKTIGDVAIERLLIDMVKAGA